METQLTDTAASSSAAQETFAIPTDPKAYQEWQKTGNLPEPAKEGTPKEASTPSEENASAADDAAENAAASAPASKQEKAKSKSAAAIRLEEVLADLKRAGLSPEELKTFKREAQAAASSETPAKAAPEKTAQPQGLVEPVKPKMSDKNPDGTDKYKTWEELDDAKDAYHDAMATYRAKLAVQEDRQQRAAEAQQQTLAQKVTEAKTRYGDQTESTIGSAVRSIIGDKDVSPVVQQMLNESPLLVDVMYVLGSKPEELASFVDMAKSNPGAAIRKVALLEQLVEQELAKGTGKAAAAGEGTEAGTAERGADGKFVSQNTPAKSKTPAPPPPEELNTRRSAPGDPVEAAVRDGDFRKFFDEENRRDLAKRRGA